MMLHKFHFPELQGLNGNSHKMARCISAICPRTPVKKWLDVVEMNPRLGVGGISPKLLIRRVDKTAVTTYDSIRMQDHD